MASRQHMDKCDMSLRRCTMNEVKTGFAPHQALAEAGRCLFCHDAPCVAGCPVAMDIPGFIRRIAQRNFTGAARVIRQANPLGAVCARACPSEHLCEKSCTSSGIAEPIAVADLQRYATDQELARGISPMKRAEPTGRRVAVVGAGPAGLACAARLSQMGESVTVFDCEARPGGLMRYGIPRYRLPLDVVSAEIDWIFGDAVEWRGNVQVGRDILLGRLTADFDAVFIGTGLEDDHDHRIAGDDAAGVVSAYAFLRMAARTGDEGEDVEWPAGHGVRRPLGKVIVLGGGNSAMDAACVALRFGADSVAVAYRRTEAEMPAWSGEVGFACEEGVEMRFLLSPAEILSAGGWATGVRFTRMKMLDAGDARAKPVPSGEADEVIGADTVILAFGRIPGDAFAADAADAADAAAPERTAAGTIWRDTATGATSAPGVFAGGDVTNGGGTVVQAVRDGLAAAAGIRAYLDASPGVR